MKVAEKQIRILELSLAVGLACALLWGVLSLGRQTQLADKVIRLHVLANSDTEYDQALKLRVRDRVVARAAEILETTDNRVQAKEKLTAALPELSQLAAAEIADCGYGYPVETELEETRFPTREYDGFTLPAGDYLALRVVIGSGEGHNWWCVVFPPLCMTAATDLSQTAMASGLSEEDVGLITEETGYVLQFKSIELWERLQEKFSGCSPQIGTHVKGGQ
ncbi:MAG: stage II sporulation protein R [Oscillospiraceae bacterium]